MTSRVRPYLVVLFLACLSFGLTLRLGFIWDDHEMIENNPVITEINQANLKHAFTRDVFDGKGDAYYRPLQTIANMVDYHFWKLRPVGYHLTNLAFHVLAALLLLLLFRFLFDSRLAFMAAAFFAVNPIVVEQLIIIAGRAELMALAFTLAALVCCLKRNTGAYVAAAVFYFLACLSKESGAVFPLFLALIGWIKPEIRPRPWVYGLFAAVFVGYWWLRSNAVAAPPLPPVGELALMSIRELPTIFLEYIRIIVFPVDLHSHRRMVFAKIFMFLSPLFFLLLFLLAYMKRSRVAWIAAAWFFIGMLPKVPNFAVSSLMLDHWGYVSAIGIFILFARGFMILSEGSAAVRLGAGAAFSLILVFWIFCSWNSIALRKTDYELYRHALRYPSSSVVRGNLAMLYYQSGYFNEAEQLVDEALRINPGNTQARLIKEKIISSRPRS